MRAATRLLTAILCVAMLATGCGKSEPSKGTGGPESAKRRFAVIHKGLTHEHWKAIEAGAKKAAAEAGNVEIIYKSAPKEDDTQLQINLVQSFISSRVDGMILAPLSDQALVAPVRLAAQAGIPVIIIDSPLAAQVGKDFVCYIGTDNYKAGVLGGRRLGEVMQGKGTVLLLRFAESSASTREREQGFLDTLKKDFAGISVIDPPQYAGPEVNSAKRASENMITAYLGKFDGVFCPNETSAAGMLIALEDRQLAGKVRFVGFDANPRVIAGVREKKLDGVVLQDPFKMGYQSVKAMLDHIAGKPVPPSTDTGAAVATPENVNAPEIHRLIYPLEAAASRGS
jgi:ribose transport system substrate-binding protein